MKTFKVLIIKEHSTNVLQFSELKYISEIGGLASCKLQLKRRKSYNTTGHLT